MTEQAAVQGGSLLARTQAFLSDRTGVLILSSMILSVALIDQWTKSVIVQNLRLFEIIEVIPNLFNITYVLNPGAAFGILGGIDSQWRQIVILGVTALALCVIVYFLLYDYQHDRVAQVALGSILGGALGNLIDRVMLGHVVDFLDFYVGSYHWPAFNVADSAICVGVVVLLLRRPMELPVQQKNEQ